MQRINFCIDKMKHGVGHQMLVLLSVVLISMCSLVGLAQSNKKRPPFDPKRFEADLEQYITVNAKLTPREAAKFFPVYRQMMRKMRAHFDEMRRYRFVNPSDERACAEAIRRQDELDIDMKQLQQEYHTKFMYILPASKVLSIIKAEEQFHRQAFRRAGNHKKNP